MKRGSKKALSTIVSTLLILLLVFVAIGILWVVVKGLIEDSTETISLGKYTLDLKIDQVSINQNSVSVKVKRNPGEGDFVKIKFIFSDGKNSETFDRNVSLKEYEKRSFSFSLQEIEIDDLEKIEIVPIFKLESGKEVAGDVKDSYNFEKESVQTYDCSTNCSTENYECGTFTFCGFSTSCGNCQTLYGSDYVCNSGTCVLESECNEDCSDVTYECGTQTICDEECIIGDCTSANEICNVNVCESCPTNYGDCDNNDSTGCETNLNTDSSNCGSCGNDCQDGYSCVSGSCVEDSEECTSNNYTQCYDGNVYWYDSCGEREGVYDYCSSEEVCSSGECVYVGGGGGEYEINVIGPHEFWTHSNAQNGDYVGYVKFFDMDENVNPSFSIVSGNNGAFEIEKTTESPRDLFPSGLIRIANRNSLSAGATYNLGVRIYDSATDKDSTANVIVHVATNSQTVYIDSNAGSGGDGSYSSPYDEVGDVGDWNYEGGKVYLFKRGSYFQDHIWLDDDNVNQNNPLVIGAYGSGDRPEFDGTVYGKGYGDTGILIGRSSTSNIMSHIYVQNLEVYNWGYFPILNSPRGDNHLFFTDLYVHHGDNTVWWLWGKNQHSSEDLDITIVNCEVSHGVGESTSGTKWYAGGVHAYNFYAHDNTGNGIRFIWAPDKVCMGCVSHDNGRHGIQLRSGNSRIEYFKSYNNGGYGATVWHEAVDDDNTRYYFSLKNGELYDNNNPGLDIWGRIKHVMVEDLEIRNNAGDGLRIFGYLDITQNITVKDSLIDNNGEYGVFISDKLAITFNGQSSTGTYGADYFILGNTISNNDNGLFADYVHGLTITGNEFSGNSGDDIEVDSSRTSDVTISGNEYL